MITGVQAGDLVVVRPNGSYLPRGVPLLKYVAALAEQTVCRIGRSAAVDTIEMGDAREGDSCGRALAVWQGWDVIGLGQVFLIDW
jgi:type IV secretory pathway protease TraF